tara:strand:- start:1506 stop:1775 length:270 start_codon:yes stop_codon:yes gene_type:complete
MKSWRSGSRNTLNARPITAKDMPVLIKNMMEDGLIATITSTGITWEIGGYRVSKSSVKDAWNLSNSQMNRVCNYVYETGWDDGMIENHS